MTNSRDRVELDTFLADKLCDWYAGSQESESEQLRQACKLMTNFLSDRPSSEFISADSPEGAVVQLKYALDDFRAWEEVENELNELSAEELDRIQFPDLVHQLCLSYG